MIYLGSLSAICFLSSCNGSEAKSDILKGKWNILKAARNGKITTTLEDGFFLFSSDTTLQTNIFEEEKEYRMTKNDKGFIQHYREVGNVQYDIKIISNDSITLNADIQDYKFMFLAVRDTIFLD